MFAFILIVHAVNRRVVMARRHYAAGSAEGMPSLASREVADYAANLGFTIPNDELEAICERLTTFIDGLNLQRLEQVDRNRIGSWNAPRDPGRVPTAAEDPYNAIVRFCEVKGNEYGTLADLRVGVKDNIAVAGVPMTSGTAHDEQPVPIHDSLVVEQLLDAGALIAAKTNMWPSRDSAIGEARNPHNPEYSPGFSSSGSGVAVAGGIVDAALGTDVGGSVRIPAAWCGLVGMKATCGLVPSYYGREPASEIGPITKTVMDSARILDVMASFHHRTRTGQLSYTKAAQCGIRGVRIGVVEDALEPSGCTKQIRKAFDRAQKCLVNIGACLVPISIPLWTALGKIHRVTNFFDEIVSASSLGLGTGYTGWADPTLISTRASNGRLPVEIRRSMLLAAEHFRRPDQAVYISRAHNIRWEFSRQIDTILSDVDLLITPTTICAPHRLEDPVTQALVSSAIKNTWPINLTGHPALTVPCGKADHGLPAGLQIIGRKFDEYLIYQAGFAMEQCYNLN